MGSINNSLQFGSVDSADYGILISGEGTFNAPERDVDTIEIPGRNGDLLIDKGRFKNITVEYKAYSYAEDMTTFRQQLSDFRNALTSQVGYQKLTDTFHPDEYRLGTFISGFEAEPVMFNTVAEVVLKFDCKPQRFLFTGEEVFTLGEWGETETKSGSIVSFEGNETTAVKSLTAHITPKQSGSGDPSPDNVRPISGYDSVNVKRIGKNFLAYDRANGSYVSGGLTYTITDGHINVNGTSTSNYPTLIVANPLPLKAGTYTISKTVSGTVPSGAYLYIIVENSGLPNAPSVRGGNSSTFTITEDRDVRIVLCAETSGKTWDNVGVDFQIEKGSTATDYEPYQGTSYPISLGQTVYGGTLDVVSGKLTIDKALVDMGTLNYQYASLSNSRHSFGLTLGNLKPQESQSVPISAVSSMYKAVSYSSSWSNGNMSYNGGAGATKIIFINNDYTDATTFKTAMNGVQLVYELATPTEITLTPTEVNTLLGQNNIWADSGDVEVTIGQDPNVLINPTKFESLPIIETQGAGTLTINNSTITITNTGKTILDSEMMEAYMEENGAIIPKNDSVSGEFPKLQNGANMVSRTGITSVKITPRWWEL